MSTTVGWDIPGYEAAPEAVPDQEAEELGRMLAEADVATPVGWWRDMRDDSKARKARGANRWWLMRWMAEQPTAVADYLDYYTNQRDDRPGGRRGWGLRTTAPLVNGGHALFYVAYGWTVGLAVTLASYALAWIAQRPGRFFLLALAAGLIKINLAIWLG